MASYNGYDLSPAATNNSTALGQNVGQISAAPSYWDQLNSNVPGFTSATTSAMGDINSELNGQLSSSTQSNIGNYAASRGVALGQPNSALSNLIGMNVTGTTTEGLQKQGISDYNSTTSNLGQMQQNPQYLTNIAETNATNAAAPNPTMAASYAQQLFNQYLNQSKSPAGYGSSGGYGGSSNPYSNMGFASQNGGNLNYGTNATNPFQTGIGQTYSTYGSGNTNVDYGYGGDFGGGGFDGGGY